MLIMTVRTDARVSVEIVQTCRVEGLQQGNA